MTDLSEISPTSNADLSLPQYWEREKGGIAKTRRWFAATLPQYDRHIRFVVEAAEQAGIEIGALPLRDYTVTRVQDLHNALIRYGRNRNWKDSTIQVRWNAVAQILLYAKDSGLVSEAVAKEASTVNTAHISGGFHRHKKNATKYPLVPEWHRPQTREELEGEYDKARDRVKTLKKSLPNHQVVLSLQKMLLLYKYTQAHVTDDKIGGLAIGLAIELFTGLRPAEARGLTWRAMKPFNSAPTKFFFTISQTAADDGTIKNHGKTPNAMRYMPIHDELQRILQSRLEYLKKKGAFREEDFIICKGTDGRSACKAQDFASFAKYVFDNELSEAATSTDVESALAEAELDAAKYQQLCREEGIPVDCGFDAPDVDESEHYTLYTLRKTFCTWIGVARLHDEQQSYLMGHKIMQNRKNLRKQYNHEDKLLDMLRRMHNWHLDAADHGLRFTPTAEQPSLTAADVDFLDIDFSQQGELPSGKYIIRVKAGNPDEPIHVEMSGENASADYTLNSLPAESASVERPATGYDNYQALLREQDKRKG